MRDRSPRQTLCFLGCFYVLDRPAKAHYRYVLSWVILYAQHTAQSDLLDCCPILYSRQTAQSDPLLSWVILHIGQTAQAQAHRYFCGWNQPLFRLRKLLKFTLRPTPPYHALSHSLFVPSTGYTYCFRCFLTPCLFIYIVCLFIDKQPLTWRMFLAFLCVRALSVVRTSVCCESFFCDFGLACHIRSSLCEAARGLSTKRGAVK